jgi:hypothetical protein
MLDKIRVGDTIVVSASALHPVHCWHPTRGADTISSVSDQIFEFSQRLNRFSAPLLPNTLVLLAIGMMEKDGLCVLLGHLTAMGTWVFIGLTSAFAVGGFQRLLDSLQP